MKKLQELKEGIGGNYILPFLWMHGESHDIILEEIDKIYECGIREICLESRPHPDFCGPKWWSDVDYVLHEAKKRGMRIWVLDDDKFPTGHANGAFATKHPELAKIYLAERHMDIIGPAENAAVLIQPFLGGDGKLLGVVACPKPDTESLEISDKGIIDLTENIYDGLVYFNIPKGRYRLFVFFTTQTGGGRQDYMNLIDDRSVKVLLDEVYEPHYERYRDEFGKTFAGFFSDEPELGNTSGYDFHEVLGKKDVRLPWSDALQKRLKNFWKERFLCYLPALWYGMGEKTVPIRSEYMEQVTSLVKECFSGQIGYWCEEHGIEYIGHIIEDDNAHARMGCGIGHYFREQWGQHRAGIDVVHFQIVPGFHDKVHRWLSWETDGEFFHFGLAKLGSSCAHIDPRKKGRALCEIFGNYGWAEGIPMMKWLCDHMLVRGINHFVPHAFSPKFPDRDCPPHFYARGNNPTFCYFAELMRYVNRMCHLLNGGVHIADAAVLYHAEAEWSGGNYMLFQKPIRRLMENQMDADIIPAEVLQEGHALIKNGKLHIHSQEYGCLIIPGCEYLSEKVAGFVVKAAEQGLPVYVVEEMPRADIMHRPLREAFRKSVVIVALTEIADLIRKNQGSEISCSGFNPDLRFLCCKQDNGMIYYFFNESIDEKIDTQITIRRGRYTRITEYDALNNEEQCYRIVENRFPLSLEPGQAVVLILQEAFDKDAKDFPVCEKEIPVDCNWTVSLADTKDYPNFRNHFIIAQGKELPNLNGPEYFPGFSGYYRYEGSVDVDFDPDLKWMLRFPEVGDCGRVIINGHKAGVLIGSPNRVEITSYLCKGKNVFCIELSNTLVWQIRDGASTQIQIPPTGITAKPVLEVYRNPNAVQVLDGIKY